MPPGFKEKAFVKSLKAPSTFGFAPDGRLFICEQTGEVKIFRDGALLDKLFLKLEVNSKGEHGMLGITFDPQFALNHYVYIYYTATTPYVHNRVSRFTADQDVGNPNEEQILMDLPDLQGSEYHSAGALRFGNDDKLYIGVGDNAGRPFLRNAQLMTSLFGKILRVNSDGTPPTDNPFYKTTTGIYQSIWALGLRNPFTIAFLPGTNNFYINDVGPLDWEEINESERGGNYGWPDAIGPAPGTISPSPDTGGGAAGAINPSSDAVGGAADAINPSPGAGGGSPDTSGYKNPIFTYPHGRIGDNTSGCAITGGTFYNPKSFQFPEAYRGKYFFIDYCNNWVKILNPEDKSVTTFATEVAPNPVSIIVGPDGALYYISRWLRGIYRLGYTPQ